MCAAESDQELAIALLPAWMDQAWMNGPVQKKNGAVYSSGMLGWSAIYYI